MSGLRLVSSSRIQRWPHRAPEQAEAPVGDKGRVLNLEVGALTPDQINLVLTHLPVDVTYVDENDEVRYFSLGKSGSSSARLQ